MKVVLIKNVEKLGKEGDIIEVKDGYARNFLIPTGVALRAIKGSFHEIEEMKKRKVKSEEKGKKEAIALKEKIEEISITLTTEVKEGEEIYGSISEPQILRALKEEGFELDKGKLTLDEPIKKLGVYNLKVKLHPAVEANLRVWVMKK
ncbi:MAG: 50S ribosomal protein L9 [Candidatus Omnitrophota bacterium]|nr:50S ribosomal protein L9 [Candidatus Omnitrophota bacterium]